MSDIKDGDYVDFVDDDGEYWCCRNLDFEQDIDPLEMTDMASLSKAEFYYLYENQGGKGVILGIPGISEEGVVVKAAALEEMKKAMDAAPADAVLTAFNYESTRFYISTQAEIDHACVEYDLPEDRVLH